MMAVWKEMTVGDLCDSISDTYRRNDNEVILVNTSDVLEGKVLNHQCVENKNLKGQFKKTFQKDDILYSEIRPANKRYAYIDFDDTEQYIAPTKLMVLRPKKEIILPRFLFAFLSSNHVLMELQHLAETRSGTFPQITFSSELAPMLISVPDFATQEKIVGILNSIEERIQNNNAINENLQQQAFALFDQLMLESGDSKCLVSDVAYLNPKRQLSKNQVARCIDMSQLSTSGAFPSGWDMKPFNGGMRFINGDTLLARITPCLENGKTAYIDFLDKKEVAFGSTEYIVLAPREGVPPEYLYCLARYPAFVDYAVKNMNGSSGRQRVSADTIGKFVMNHPSEDALRNFGDIATALFMKMRYNSFENLRLVSLRDAILPRLMSGELDVSGLDL